MRRAGAPARGLPLLLCALGASCVSVERYKPCGDQGTELRVSDEGAQAGEESLVWTGHEFGLVWVQQDGIHFQRFDRSAHPLARAAIVVRADPVPLDTALAWTGSGYAVAWLDERDDLEGIHFLGFASDGTPSGDPVDVATADAPSFRRTHIELAPTDSAFGLAWNGEWDDGAWFFREYQEVFYVALDRSGRPTREPASLCRSHEWLGGGCSRARLVTAGDGLGIFWIDPGEGSAFDDPTWFLPAGADAVPFGAPVQLSDDRLMATASWDGGLYGAVFEDPFASTDYLGLQFVTMDLRGTRLSVPRSIEWDFSAWDVTSVPDGYVLGRDLYDELDNEATGLTGLDRDGRLEGRTCTVDRYQAQGRLVGFDGGAAVAWTDGEDPRGVHLAVWPLP
ncbi:MAG: hypothetical protein HY825_12230 [Acidobacteria bacterium]|nr:hypothetical protein [Acidobacteriota bacterium]